MTPGDWRGTSGALERVAKDQERARSRRAPNAGPRSRVVGGASASELAAILELPPLFTFEGEVRVAMTNLQPAQRQELADVRVVVVDFAATDVEHPTVHL